jgi:hypothetical protein
MHGYGCTIRGNAGSGREEVVMLEDHVSAGLRNEKGLAMFWVVIAMASAVVTGLTIHYIAGTDRAVSDNLDVEARALFAAQQALVEYTATWSVGTEFELEATKIVDEEDPGDGPPPGHDDEDDDDVDPDAMVDFFGTELKLKTFTTGPTEVTITPRKVTEAIRGDTWLVEADASVPDRRRTSLDAIKVVRTFARFQAPFNPMAAFSAPNGMDVRAGSDHFHVDGKKKGKCGESGLPPMAVPDSQVSMGIGKPHIKGDDGMKEIDDTFESYQELRDSLDVPWTKLKDAVLSGSIPVSLVNPDLATLDFKATFPKDKKKSKIWPVILIQGPLEIKTSVKGWGFLLIDGALILTDGKLDWKGIIMTGKQIEVYDAHLHAKGLVVTGLACTQVELDAGTCRNILDGKHLGVKYNQCEADAAWQQLLALRQVPGGLHTRMY